MGGGVPMILGIGVDLVAVEEVERAFHRQGDAFLERLLTPRERAACGAAAGDDGPAAGGDGPAPGGLERIAARFAAKEAAMKALGTGWGGGVGFADIEVVGGRNARPGIEWHGGARAAAQALGATQVHLSLTHSAGLAVAVVVLEGAGPASAATAPPPGRT